MKPPGGWFHRAVGITINFGPEIGTRVSCGAYRNYAKEELLGKQIIAVVNFGEKKMGPEISQVLILGVPNEAGETIYLRVQTQLPRGFCLHRPLNGKEKARECGRTHTERF